MGLGINSARKSEHIYHKGQKVWNMQKWETLLKYYSTGY